MTWALAVAAGLAVLLWPRRRGAAVSQSHPADGRGPAAVSSGDGTSRPGRGRRGAAPEPSMDEAADALVLVALALRAGLDLTRALQEVAAGAGGGAVPGGSAGPAPAVARDLSAVVAAVRWGRPVAEAWTYASSVWRPAALAWSMAEATGAAPAGLVGEAAARLREAQERDRERRAARAGVLLVLPLGLGFLPAFACTAVLPLVITLAVGVLDSTG